MPETSALLVLKLMRCSACVYGRVEITAAAEVGECGEREIANLDEWARSSPTIGAWGTVKAGSSTVK